MFAMLDIMIRLIGLLDRRLHVECAGPSCKSFRSREASSFWTGNFANTLLDARL